MDVCAGKNLTRTSFVKGSLRRARFDNSDLSGTSMFGATCTGCSFKGANLRCELRYQFIEKPCKTSNSFFLKHAVMCQTATGSATMHLEVLQMLLLPGVLDHSAARLGPEVLLPDAVVDCRHPDS
jgi:hypothetical protein